MIHAASIASPGRPRIDRSRLMSQVWKLIRHRGLRRGDRLPPEGELARRFAVSRMTLRDATGELVRQNVLERRHGVGIFVRAPVKTAIGMFVGARAMDPTTSLFSQWALTEVRAAVRRHQGEMRLFFFDDDDGSLDTAGHEAIRQRKIDGVLLFSTPQSPEQLKQEVLSPLARERIPVVGLFKYEPASLHRVHINMSPVLRALMKQIVGAGHAEAGLAGKAFVTHRSIAASALEEARAAGLKTTSSWIFPGDNGERNSIARGRQIFRVFDEQACRPSALVFMDHFEAQGFMHALLAKTRTVPAAPMLFVLEASNVMLELPWEVTRIRLDLRPAVERGVALLYDLIEGKAAPARKVCLEPSLI